MTCPASRSLFYVKSSDLITLRCDLENGHEDEDHFDKIFNLHWREPESNVMAKLRVPENKIPELAFKG